MSLSASHTSRFIRSRPTIECGKCGEQLLVPERSEYIDECSVRHVWICEACDYALKLRLACSAYLEMRARMYAACERRTESWNGCDHAPSLALITRQSTEL